MPVINTNVSSLITQNALAVNSRAQSTAMQQLSTGLRINGAKDDAAGLAIASKMTSQIKGLDQAVRNSNDAISMLQTADGALSTVSDMMQRMREVAVQASSDTNVVADRTALDGEFNALSTEIDRVAKTTQWNTMNILDVSVNKGKFTFQVGANNEVASAVEVNIAELKAPTGDLTTLKGAQTAISEMDTAIEGVNSMRSDLGANINRLTYASENLSNISQNASASRSRVQDTDYAKASTELARTQIISQAATAMLAQANQSQQSVLALLK
jgi:flagellin